VAFQIVCGVDDSQGGREALVAAAALSQRLALPLVAVNVASAERVFPYGDAATRERQRHRAITKAERLLDHIASSRGRAGEIAKRVELGRPAARLAALAGEEGAQFIVVGSRGRSRLGAALLGSVSRELVSRAPCPVLVVPPGSNGIRRQNCIGASSPSVVCGIDDSPESGRAAREAAALARRLGDPLVVAHAYQQRRRRPASRIAERRKARARLEAAAVALPPTVVARLRLERGDPAGQVRRVAEEERAELIVVGSRARGPAPRPFSGSVASDLASSGPTPVLIVIDDGWRDVVNGERPLPPGGGQVEAPQECLEGASPS
jgi:nucleotide-binding universal stress UspA family protein